MGFGIKRYGVPGEVIYSKMYIESHNGSYAAYIRGKRCTSEELFFYEVSAAFQFPSYFGENWAAFDECICDLEWLKFNKIFIAIDNFTQMFNKDKKNQLLLINYLGNMVEYWESKEIPVEIWLNN